MRASDCPCLGCTPETGRHSECHSSCAGYKSFLDKYKKEKKKEFHDLPIPGMVTPDDRKKKQKASKKGAKEQITPSMACMSPQERKENDEKLRLMLGRYDAAKMKRIHYNKIWNDISTYIVPSLNNNFNI